MCQIIRCSTIALVLAASTAALAEDTVLFNGKNLEGWSYHVRDDEKVKKVTDAWVVQQGMLVSTGVSKGYLKHNGQFEDYALTLEWRSMRRNGNGVIVGGLGSIFIHTTDEEGTFHYPKSVEVSLNDIGAVYFRDVTVRTDPKKWAFRAPDFADDVEKDLGEWNHLKLICRGNRLTVIVNGTPVNQIEGLNRTKGAVAIQSQRGTFPAPMFYRNIRVQPLSNVPAEDEKGATRRLAKFKAMAAAKQAAADAKRQEEEKRKKMRAEGFAKQWATIKVSQEIDFKPDALQLPFPADARELEFDGKFGDIEMMSGYSLAAISKFYRTEMAKRGWKEAKKKRDEDSAKVTFKQDQAKVEMSLYQKSKGVQVKLDCKGLSFEGTNDPAGLVKQGIPQPHGYVFLQKEIQLPSNIQDLTYDEGNRCLFKSGLGLQDAFDQLGSQLRAKGYRETRRPIISGNRRYTEFAKGPIEVSVNVFSHKVGSRVVLEYEEN